MQHDRAEISSCFASQAVPSRTLHAQACGTASLWVSKTQQVLQVCDTLQSVAILDMQAVLAAQVREGL
jgi:hypothetical protein